MQKSWTSCKSKISQQRIIMSDISSLVDRSVFIFFFIRYRAVDPVSGRTLAVYSDQPGVQLYTSNGLPVKWVPFTISSSLLFAFQGPVRLLISCLHFCSGSDEAFPPGKGGVKYHKHGAFCLETQNFPDAIHHVSCRLLSFLTQFQW